MNMKRILLAAAAAAMIMSGCGNGDNAAGDGAESSAAVESTKESSSSEAQEESSEEVHIMLPTAGPENSDAAISDEEKTEAAEESAVSEAETEEAGNTAAVYDNSAATEASDKAVDSGSEAGFADNFAVDQASAAAFAEQIKTAVAFKDIEALADLAAYPLYVGFSEGSEDIRSKDEFIALGADRVFTDALLSSIAAADTSALSPSMAGFTLSDGDTANIIFGVRDGSLAISGINY